MKLRHRLVRLEQRLPAGCPACRHRRGLVALVTVREEPDEPAALPEGAPLQCAVCGNVPEQIIEIVEQVVELALVEDSVAREGTSRSRREASAALGIVNAASASIRVLSQCHHANRPIAADRGCPARARAGPLPLLN
jgi:hypothetical protein